MVNFTRLIFGKPAHPYVRNLRETREDTIFFESLTRGKVVSGDPGTGKTTWEALELTRYFLTYPDRPVFIDDASGSLTNEVIEIVHYLPPRERDSILERIILDIPGHEKWVIPKPFFSPEYGLSDEDLVQKAKTVIAELHPQHKMQTPMMYAAIDTTAPHLFRLLMAIKNEFNRCWQITEGKNLLIDHHKGGDLYKACKKFGGQTPAAKWYFEKTILHPDVTATDIASRTAALISSLSVIETEPLRARYGHDRPTVTVQEVIEKGLIYIKSGEKIANQPDAQAFVFWDEFASLKAVINKRTPHDPHDKPVLWEADEVYRLFEIEGMAKAIGEVSTYFRSRKLMPVLIIQAFWQLDELLREQIWNLGNIVTFSMSNQRDAYIISQQLGEYDPRSKKYEAPTQRANPTAEPDRGQYLQLTDFIQKKMAWRQMLMRRYINEREKDPYIRFVRQTREKPKGTLPASLTDIKEELFKKRALAVKDVLKAVNQRRGIVSSQSSTERPTAE